MKLSDTNGYVYIAIFENNYVNIGRSMRSPNKRIVKHENSMKITGHKLIKSYISKPHKDWIFSEYKLHQYVKSLDGYLIGEWSLLSDYELTILLNVFKKLDITEYSDSELKDMERAAEILKSEFLDVMFSSGHNIEIENPYESLLKEVEEKFKYIFESQAFLDYKCKMCKMIFEEGDHIYDSLEELTYNFSDFLTESITITIMNSSKEKKYMASHIKKILVTEERIGLFIQECWSLYNEDCMKNFSF